MSDITLQLCFCIFKTSQKCLPVHQTISQRGDQAVIHVTACVHAFKGLNPWRCPIHSNESNLYVLGLYFSNVLQCTNMYNYRETKRSHHLLCLWYVRLINRCILVANHLDHMSAGHTNRMGWYWAEIEQFMLYYPSKIWKCRQHEAEH